MRKLSFILLSLALVAGCSKSDALRSKEFSHTGCASETRAGGSWDEPSLLQLKYENGDLRVTRTNALMNCSIKDGGIACDVSVEGDVIRYVVYEKDGPTANCICPVKEMTSLVTDLQEGKEYTLKYCHYAPVTFTFKKGLHKVFDVDDL